MRAIAGLAAGVAVASIVAACTSESSRTAATTDPCLLANCSDASTPPIDASRPDAAKPPQDAAAIVDGASGAVFGFDGARPPYDSGSGVPERDAEWVEGGPTGPGGPVGVTPPEERAVCTNAGPLGFSTASLTAYSVPTGADPFQEKWAAAAQRTGHPGPALVVLDTLGLLPDGGVRSARVGAPRTTSGGAPFGFAASATNPLAFAWSLDGQVGVSGTTGAGAVGPGLLRFKTSSGNSVDIPFVSAELSARFVFDVPSNACTALQVSSLAFAIPASAGATLLEGESLASLLGAPNATLGGQTAYWRVVLRGSAPVVTLQASP
jgi:hypothetical protein